MYKSFSVRNFCGLRDLKIDSLERVNLITGKNNMGKTALLEALSLHARPNDPGSVHILSLLRGRALRDAEDLFHSLFIRFNPKSEIHLEAYGDWGANSRTLHIKLVRSDVTEQPLTASTAELQHQDYMSYVSQPPYEDRIEFAYTDETSETFLSAGRIVETRSTDGKVGITLLSKTIQTRHVPSALIFLASGQRPTHREDAERFGRIEIVGKQKRVEAIVKLLEPCLNRLTVVPHASTSMLYADLEGYERLLPLALLGDGMVRLLSLAVAIGNAENGIVLVDEIENGLHHTVMKKIWSGIAQFAREFNVQIFATTQSWECIRSAHEAFSEDELYDFRLHRLERVKDTDDIRAVSYDQETLDIALKKELEVR